MRLKKGKPHMLPKNQPLALVLSYKKDDKNKYINKKGEDEHSYCTVGDGYPLSFPRTTRPLKPANTIYNKIIDLCNKNILAPI